ncbi:hypothetical protein [Candidatus Phytoplasma phoenicium]|uniref:Uncharacterized protein n=1 Tax=Candidatus Phytoplasma phoenicium TaxID=198422 RepID=A0A0L0ML56_9MOLU|nr:hypothetical protein [Candidatus Phytoplasma phoenicium]KND62734.1 hypothetical protein AlmWB_00800 [Candidatus Phytoplasma phoenicium]
MKKITKYIYDLKSILKYLLQETKFKIVCVHQKTNYNTCFKCLYLNYRDLLTIHHLLLQFPSPPFQIDFSSTLTQNYLFDVSTKKLLVNEEKTTLQSKDPIWDDSCHRLEKQVLGDL